MGGEHASYLCFYWWSEERPKDSFGITRNQHYVCLLRQGHAGEHDDHNGHKEAQDANVV